MAKKKDLEIWEAVVLMIVIIGALNWLWVAIQRMGGNKVVFIPDLFWSMGIGNSFITLIVYSVVGAAGIASLVSVGMRLSREKKE